MKLPLLLAQYLYKNKSLSLPGIGILVFDGIYDDEKSISSGTIQFTPTVVKTYEEDLIAFIRLHTKKMQPIIYSDLDVFISEIKEFTNIGNPWYVEGIGTFRKNRDGGFEFTQGEPIAQKLEDRRTRMAEESASVNSPDRYYVDNASRSTLRSLMFLILLLGGLGGICWGGYYLYTQYMATKEGQPNIATNAADSSQLMKEALLEKNLADSNAGAIAPVLQDSGFVSQLDTQPYFPKDSPLISPSDTATTSTNSGDLKRWRFVLRKGDKEIVEKRYLQLKSFNKPVLMGATGQPNEYMVYLVLNVAVKDTLHIKDSLRIHYNNPIEVLP